jgi:hypothetical protein
MSFIIDNICAAWDALSGKRKREREALRERLDQITGQPLPATVIERLDRFYSGSHRAIPRVIPMRLQTWYQHHIELRSTKPDRWIGPPDPNITTLEYAGRKIVLADRDFDELPQPNTSEGSNQCHQPGRSVQKNCSRSTSSEAAEPH